MLFRICWLQLALGLLRCCVQRIEDHHMTGLAVAPSAPTFFFFPWNFFDSVSPIRQQYFASNPPQNQKKQKEERKRKTDPPSSSSSSAPPSLSPSNCPGSPAGPPPHHPTSRGPGTDPSAPGTSPRAGGNMPLLRGRGGVGVGFCCRCGGGRGCRCGRRVWIGSNGGGDLVAGRGERGEGWVDTL